MRQLGVLWTAMLLLAPTTRSPAETITLDAAADNTLYEDPIGATSNGAGQYLFAGATAQDSKRRGLIRFDIAAALPPDAQIQSVTLTLHQSRTITGTEEIFLHRTLASWGEGASVGFGEEGAGAPAEPGDATWLHRQWDTIAWKNAGGDFDPVASASAFVVGTGFYSWSSDAMIDDVRTWLESPNLSHGWMILGNELAIGTAKRFNSRTHDDPALRPRLTVTYIPAPATILISTAAMMLAAPRRRVKC
jgi:hypothetical protein